MRRAAHRQPTLFDAWLCLGIQAASRLYSNDGQITFTAREIKVVVRSANQRLIRPIRPIRPIGRVWLQIKEKPMPRTWTKIAVLLGAAFCSTLSITQAQV